MTGRNMGTSKDESAQDAAVRRMADQERRVEKQRRIVKHLELQRRPVVAARALLELMESSLGIMRVRLPLISR
jgi:hypothetical protein